MILAKYIARRFLVMLLRVVALFFVVMVLIDGVDQLRRSGQTTVGLTDALKLAALNVPTSLYQILPILVLLAGISMFIGLARTSELVVMRASGLSALRFLMAPVAMAVLAGAFTIMVLNPLVAATQKRYDDLWASFSGDGGRVLSIGETGLWLRQGDGERQTVIHAGRANSDGTQLFDVTFLSFDDQGRPETRIEAARADLAPGAWVLSQARRWSLLAENPETTAAALEDGARIGSDLTADGIRDSFGTPSAVAIWDLPDFISDLERAGFSARQYRVWFQMELAQPLLFAAMLLIAAGFTMRHARFGQTGRMVLLAVLAGILIFFLRNFAQVLGQNGQIPVALAAWAPPVAAVMLSLGQLLHLEDG
jgi:lipopolysaccharide export system permease protein